jgi:hypothetical protein
MHCADHFVLGCEYSQDLAQRAFAPLPSPPPTVRSTSLLRLPAISTSKRYIVMDATLNSSTVVDTFTDFLIVAIHQILQARNIYSPATFLRAKMYGFECWHIMNASPVGP